MPGRGWFGLHSEARPRPRGAPRVDQFPGVVDLLPGEFRLAPEFHASAFRGLNSGAGSFADKATFQFRVMRCTALGRLCGAGDYAKPWPRSGLLPARKPVFAPHNIGSNGRAFCAGFVGPLPHEAGRIARYSTFRKNTDPVIRGRACISGSANTRYYAEFQLTQARAKVSFRL
jgi:hypothetical protein